MRSSGRSGATSSSKRSDGASASHRAWNDALHLLKVRDRSAGELRERLRRRGYQPAVVEAVLERARGSGLIHDAAFARRWVERRIAEHRGLRLIREELRGKGVEEAVAEEAIGAVAGRYDEVAAALAAARRRARVARGATEPGGRRRVYAWLRRRGFSSGAAEEAVRVVLAKHGVEWDT